MTTGKLFCPDVAVTDLVAQGPKQSAHRCTRRRPSSFMQKKHKGEKSKLNDRIGEKARAVVDKAWGAFANNDANKATIENIKKVRKWYVLKTDHEIGRGRLFLYKDAKSANASSKFIPGSKVLEKTADDVVGIIETTKPVICIEWDMSSKTQWTPR